MNPNRDLYRRGEREDRPLVGRHDSDKRQRQLMEFLLKKSAKQQSIHPPQDTATAADDSQSEAKVDLMNTPDDLLFSIFSLLPAESLIKLQFARKKWFALINCPVFVKFHTQQSETVLISQKLFFNETPSCPFLSSAAKTKPHFHYLDLSRGNPNFVESNVMDLVKIRATCNGLVLGVRAKNKGMLVLNPLTRKHTNLPLGTLGFKECYGLGLCIRSRTYKVVHLFREESGYTVCEILNVSTRKWSIVDGPSSELLQDIRQRPVSVAGSLYWMPWQHGCDYFVSMDLGDESFRTMKLPIFCAVNDRLIDVEGALGFVTHATLNLMQVWILNRNEDWIKRYSINLSFDVRRVVPICSSGNGKRILFEYPGRYLYVCDVEKGEMKKVYSRDDEVYYEGAETIFIPHRNTLESWEGIV